MPKLSGIKQRFGTCMPYVFLCEARWALRDCLRTLDQRVYHRRVVSLTSGRPSRGTVLLSYIIDGFLHPDKIHRTNHTNYWEAVQMARTFMDLGYDVDAVSFRNDSFHPEKDYAVVIDSRHHLERWSSILPRDCVKIFHIDVSHILFHNAAEATRLLALQQRRGVTLLPRRYERPNLGIEHADCATLIGNAVTARTFGFAKKPIYCLPSPTAVTYEWPDGKDWARARGRFIFLSSGGLIHKGLDLVLEAFAGMPEYELFVCAPVDPEPPGSGSCRQPRIAAAHFDSNFYANPSSFAIEDDFRRAFARELYGTPNIRTLGWTDIGSTQFVALVRSCIAVLHPSCSEGCSTAVTTCMHAGLIPIVSQESGIDVHDFGVLLKTCSIDDIQEAVHTVAALPSTQLEARSRKAWEWARLTHTRERYAEEYRRAIVEILSGREDFRETGSSGSRG